MYEPYLDRLTKLGFLASGIHQLVFTAKSALPFAVGQVQVGALLRLIMTFAADQRRWLASLHLDRAVLFFRTML